MPIPRIEHLAPPSRDRRPLRFGWRFWREWCFFRVALKHFGLRFFIIGLILIGGAILFVVCEPEKNHDFFRAIFYTWSLVFGQPPEEFPKSVVLRLVFFIVPVLGLTVIIEGIVDFALMLRDRRRYERSWCVMLASSMSDHIVLVGFGKLGYRIFTVLRKLGEPVVVLERDDKNQFLEELRRDGSPVLIGDARNDALLREANITRAKSVILATDDDLANLEIALDARRLQPNIRVVLRMFDQNIADKMADGFNIHLAMSQSALSAPTFAVSAVAPSVVSSVIVGDRLVVMQRYLIRADGPMQGQTIGQVMQQRQMGVLELQRPDQPPMLFPLPDEVLHPGDGVVLQGELRALEQLRRENAENRSQRANA